MGKTRSKAGKFWFNAGLSLSVAGMPWTAAVSLLGTSTIAALASTPTPAQAAMLSSWEFDPTTQALMVTVPGGTTPRYFLAAEPARIVLDLPNTEVGTVPLQETYGGAVREIRVAQFEPGVTRIVLELAPGTVLAPGHVELQQVEEASGGNRWVLRPLVATNASVATNPAPNSPEAGSALEPVSDFTSPPSSPTASVPMDSTPEPDAELPPLEPGATEIPVELPPNAVAPLPAPDETIAPAPLIGMSTEAAATAELPTAESSTETTAPQVTVPALPDSEPESGVAPETPAERSQARTTATQPTTEATQPESVRMPFATESPGEVSEGTASAETEDRSEASSEASTVSVSPDIADNSQQNPEDSPVDKPQDVEDRTNPSNAPTSMATLPSLPEAMPSPLPGAPSGGAVSVPPLEATPEPQAAPQRLTPTRPQAAPQPSAPAASTATAAIEFGQPLPKSANSSGVVTPGNSITYSSSNPILLPSGTSLRVRYTGEEPLELAAGEPQQEVLVLAEAVHDEAGNVVLPEGSYVVGRFETGEEGSRFITQAISVEGRSLILNAESESLSGQSPSQNDLLRNSALGVAAGVALGFTGIGLIPAIAAGAATAAGVTFLPNSGSSNVVQPEQVLEVRLTQDLTQVN